MGRFEPSILRTFGTNRCPPLACQSDGGTVSEKGVASYASKGVGGPLKDRKQDIRHGKTRDGLEHAPACLAARWRMCVYIYIYIYISFFYFIVFAPSHLGARVPVR